MKENNQMIEMFRISGDPAWGNSGAFQVYFRGVYLMVIASDGMDWDHVSVSLPERCPTWEEMCHIKDLFFKDDETVIQYHPPKSAYVNYHPFCLHLWRSQSHEILLPDPITVGPLKDQSAEDFKKAYAESLDKLISNSP